MRKTLSLFLAASFLLLAIPGVSATDQGSEDYIIATIVRANHGIPGVTKGTGIGWCITKVVDPTLGCIGGGAVLTSEAAAIDASGGDPEADGATKYKVMTSTSVDSLSGPNVYTILCNYNPIYNTDSSKNICEVDGSGSVDGVKDSAVEGCGVGLTTDSSGVHEGNWWAQVFMGLLWVDPQTNQVCVGTQGTMSVVFS